jgi:hypothetical protein
MSWGRVGGIAKRDFLWTAVLIIGSEVHGCCHYDARLQNVCSNVSLGLPSHLYTLSLSN